MPYPRRAMCLLQSMECILVDIRCILFYVPTAVYQSLLRTCPRLIWLEGVAVATAPMISFFWQESKLTGCSPDICFCFFIRVKDGPVKVADSIECSSSRVSGSTGLHVDHLDPHVTLYCMSHTMTSIVTDNKVCWPAGSLVPGIGPPN